MLKAVLSDEQHSTEQESVRRENKEALPRVVRFKATVRCTVSTTYFSKATKVMLPLVVALFSNDIRKQQRACAH